MSSRPTEFPPIPSASPPLSTLQVLWLVGLLGAWPGFWSDMIFPTLVSMKDDLQVSAAAAQQAVSLFFLANAVMCLWHGVMIDAWGRRRMALVALGVLFVTSVLCAMAGAVEQVWVLRVLQGMVIGLGHILCRAIIRDLYCGGQAQLMVSHTSILQSLMPIGLPLLAGWLTVQGGWRTVHVVLAASAALAWVVYWVWLPETLPPEKRRPIRWSLLWQGYRRVALSSLFLRPAGAHAMNWSAMFLYVAAGPVYVMHALDRQPTDVFYVFVPIMAGLIAGLYLLPRWSRLLGGGDTLSASLGVLALAHGGNLALAWWGVEGLALLVPLLVCALGIGLTMPVLVMRALQPFGDQAGMAASLQMFLQYAMMAVTAGLMAPRLWDSLPGLALASAALSLIGWGLLHLGAAPARTTPTP